MLVLSRLYDESVFIDLRDIPPEVLRKGIVKVKVVDIVGGGRDKRKVRLGFEVVGTDYRIPIHREEVFNEIEFEKKKEQTA